MNSLRVTRCAVRSWLLVVNLSCWTLCEASFLRADHVGGTAVISLPRVDHSVVTPTVLWRKPNDRNVSGFGGSGLLVLAVRPGGIFCALKQTVTFGTIDLPGHEMVTDTAAIQRYDRIRFNVVVPSWISGFTEVRGDEDDAPSVGEVHQCAGAGSAGLGANVRHNDGGEGPHGGNSPLRVPEQRRIDPGADVAEEAKTQWRESHPSDDPMGN
jgi:hypothetical protein